MGRIKSWKYHSEKLSFSYDIYVDKEGYFSTTLPKEICEQLKAVSIQLQANRSRNEGYFGDSTMDGLISQVKVVGDKFSAKELIETKLVIRYCLQTGVSYTKDKDGSIVPNGYWIKDRDTDYCKWYEGTETRNATDRGPFHFSIYVEVKKLELYKFPDGKIHKEYKRLEEDEDYKEFDTIHWLESLASMDHHGIYDNDIKEMPYTEEAGLWFKDACLFMMKLNDGLQRFLGEDLDLHKAIEQQLALPKL